MYRGSYSVVRCDASMSRIIPDPTVSNRRHSVQFTVCSYGGGAKGAKLRNISHHFSNQEKK